jgi:serine/threonine protein kinase
VNEGRIGIYRLVRTLGRGSMGTVFEAVNEKSGQRVALKVLSAALSNDDELAERFRREALSVAHLHHPNITQTLDFGEEGERLYMAMELLEGNDLRVLIERGASGSLGQRLRVMTQVASGMGFVHAHGLVHRDLKPGNIHVTPQGVAKIMDFGLVRLGDSNMTRTGMVMGSPAYMSPEQLRGEKVDARCDVFALGSVLYELLTGQRAFPGKGMTQIMMQVVQGEPAPLALAAPEAPHALAMVVERCLRKEPAARYQTAGELHAALEALEAVYGGS